MEAVMFPRRRSTSQSHRRHSQLGGWFDFMRNPAFQIGLLIVIGLIILFLAITGQKSNAVQKAATSAAETAIIKPTGTNLPNVISVSAAYELYMSSSVYILDVRERSEWDRFHIPTTTLLPLSQLTGLVDKLPRDKPIIVISAADNRSQQARDIIKESGFTNVSSLAGGIGSWQLQGYPIEP
jgi:rhodanese-related sulfurtransferase